MITHVVLFKMKEPARDNAEAVADELRSMEGKVDGLARIEVGLDENRGPRAWDLCLITRHPTDEALAKYQADALHGEVKGFIAERIEESAVVDFRP
jgi:hypothetical protein